ncbi:cathepsin B-like protease [Acrasis kona]|uniref:Cathepsin B-like protease n=1 Tax=Acrasis kona TaxID=1008807 RepID=A0AAW2Z919_9EUKA
MWAYTCISLFVMVVVAENKQLIMIDAINSIKSWNASITPYSFLDWGQKLSMLGLIVDETINPPYNENTIVADLPKTFLTTHKWPKCLSSILQQGRCGSCWAFAGISTLQDRLCISTNGNILESLSTLNILSCREDHQELCAGNKISSAFEIAKGGVVQEECSPYITDPEGNIVDSPASCSRQVCSKYKIKRKEYRVGSFNYLNQDHKSVMSEIFVHGPVVASMMVNEDFYHLSHHEEPYHHAQGKFVGWHSVKLFGWGVSPSGVPFYHAANSWGVTWGNGGFFKIKIDEYGLAQSVCGPELLFH